MPRLTENVKTQNFEFSHVDLNELVDTEYTLVDLHLDTSGSVSGFESQLAKMVETSILALSKSPRSQNLLVRVCTFNSRTDEYHGYKLLKHINSGDYSQLVRAGGSTSLLDSLVNGLESQSNFGKQLQDMHYDANGIIILITDGCENTSRLNYTDLTRSLTDARRTENLESNQVICVYINEGDPGVQKNIDKLRAAGITDFIEAGNMSEKTLAKLANFITSSVSSSSQALGTGGPSQLLTF